MLRNWKETEAYKNDVFLLPTEFDEKVAKMRLPALGTVLTVFGSKNSSCFELECGTTPFVRGDSARSHLMLTLAGTLGLRIVSCTHAVERVTSRAAGYD